MVCTWLIDSDQFESAKVKTAVYFFDLLSIQNVLVYYPFLKKGNGDGMDSLILEIIILCRKVWTTLGREELIEAQVPSFKELKLPHR